MQYRSVNVVVDKIKGIETEEKRMALLNRLHRFAVKHKKNEQAGTVLMSFFRGECAHLPDDKGKCELCDTTVTVKMKAFKMKP